MKKILVVKRDAWKIVSQFYNCFVILLENVINETSLNSLSRDSFAFSQFCHFFILVHLVQFVFSANKIKIANGWIWTADRWLSEQLLYPLCNNHSPRRAFLIKLGHSKPLFINFSLFNTVAWQFIHFESYASYLSTNTSC